MTNRNKKEKNERPRKISAKRNAKKDKDGHVFLSGLKNFGIIFALCLVIFGLLGVCGGHSCDLSGGRYFR